MAKYNSQKYSPGRSNNRDNQKDSFTEKNRIYELFKDGKNIFYMDTNFETEFMDERLFKRIYVSRNSEDKERVCLIDDSVSIDCDFIETIKSVYLKVEEKVILTDDDGTYFLNVKMNPSSYDADSTDTVEIEGFKGFYFNTAVFSIYKQFGRNWVITGHSECLAERNEDSVNLEEIEKMNSIDFNLYYQTLRYV